MLGGAGHLSYYRWLNIIETKHVIEAYGSGAAMSCNGMLWPPFHF